MNNLCNQLLNFAQYNPLGVIELFGKPSELDINQKDSEGHSLVYQVLENYSPSYSISNSTFLEADSPSSLTIEKLKKVITSCFEKPNDNTNLKINIRADGNLIEEIKKSEKIFPNFQRIEWSFTRLYYFDVVKILIEQGMADFIDALPVAIRLNDESLIRLLLEAQQEKPIPENILGEALISAIKNNNQTLVKLLLDHCRTNSLGVEQYYLLHQVNHVDMAKTLLAFNVDMEQRDAHGNTALLAAYQRKNSKVISVLQARGAITQCSNDRKETIAHFATKSLSLLKLLPLDQNYNAQDANGNSPLHWLLMYCEKDITKRLNFILEKPVSLNLVNSAYDTPLHVLAKRGNPMKDEIARTLLQHADASLNLKNEQGHTPLDLFAQNGHLSVVKQLIEREAASTLCNESCYTPDKQDLIAGKEEVVKLPEKQNAEHVHVKNSLSWVRESFFGSKASVLLQQVNGALSQTTKTNENESSSSPST